MTHQDHLTAVRSAIIAAVPSILELKFGCEIKFPKGEIGMIVEEKPSYVWYIFPDSDEKIKRTKRVVQEYCEIIGRKIGIADVLMAMEKRTVNFGCLNINQGGLMEFESATETKRAQWDLTTDDLNLAKPETVEFLYKILCV